MSTAGGQTHSQKPKTKSGQLKEQKALMIELSVYLACDRMVKRRQYCTGSKLPFVRQIWMTANAVYGAGLLSCSMATSSLYKRARTTTGKAIAAQTNRLPSYKTRLQLTAIKMLLDAW